MQPSKYIMIDPPSGWRYGFPKKILRKDYDDRGAEVLYENGYPRPPEDSPEAAVSWVRVWDA